jgi:hypothetical protein
MMGGLDAIAVGIEDESSIVVFVVLGLETGSTVLWLPASSAAS